mmetsp:Transcript_11607/g.23930  ORF Transcript_11607/g.23930 Transcript_11607/m.23930 type:complete len:318 (+) Transcript_11607:2354-3307(+)
MAFSPPSPRRSVRNSTPESGCIIFLMIESPLPEVVEDSDMDTSTPANFSSSTELDRKDSTKERLLVAGDRKQPASISTILHHVSNGLSILEAMAYSCSTPISADTSEILPIESKSSSVSSTHSSLSYSATATALNCFRKRWSNKSSKNNPNIAFLSLSLPAISSILFSSFSFDSSISFVKKLATGLAIFVVLEKSVWCMPNFRRNDELGEGFEPSSFIIPSVGGRSKRRSNGRDEDTAASRSIKVPKGPKDPHLKPESDNRIIACWTTSSFLMALDSEVGFFDDSIGAPPDSLDSTGSLAFSLKGMRFVLKLIVKTP